MNLMVPTLLVQGMTSIEFESGGRTVKIGEIITLPYGQALIMKAMGAISTLVNEDETHIKAQDELAMYGADCFFPFKDQTISRVADYLASVGTKTDTVN